MENIAQISASTDFSRFTRLRADARRDADAAFATVAKEFEALFIKLMLKSARDASVDGGLFNNRELKLYREMLDDQVALAMADQGGLGFETVLRRQLALDPVKPSARGELQLPLPQALPLPSLPRQGDTGEDPEAATGVSRHKVESSGATAPGQAPGPAGFVEALRPLAAEAASRLGLDPEILLAQAALETGWGKHTISFADGRGSHNYFGIKADHGWQGERVDVRTLEYINGKPLKVSAQFRAYPDAAAAFGDYVAFLEQRPRYAAALDHRGDPVAFIKGLARAGYATDPNYAEKILDIQDRIKAQASLAQR